MRSPYRKSTVRDVASRAGVSQSAVSHYINGRVNVCAPETAARIDSAIAELHFSPARAMRHYGKRAANTIGVCASMIAEDKDITSGSYIHRFWEGVVRVADEYSFRITMFPASMRNSESCRPYLDGGIDGLLLSTEIGDTRPSELADAGLPTVCFVRSWNLPERCGSVIASESDIVDLAISHLWQLGHRRIAYFGPRSSCTTAVNMDATSEDRHSYWTAWAIRNLLDIKELTGCTDSYNYQPSDVTEPLIKKWIAMTEGPSAVFCGSDRLAMSLMTACKKLNVNVPTHLSVIGVDNEGASAAFEPSLTSIDVPVFQVGFEAALMLIQMINEGRKAEQIKVPVRDIIVRNSTGRPHNNGS